MQVKQIHIESVDVANDHYTTPNGILTSQTRVGTL